MTSFDVRPKAIVISKCADSGNLTLGTIVFEVRSFTVHSIFVVDFK
jgi:hypothetical protein